MNPKPKQYYNHLFKSIYKYKQLPSYFIFYPTSRCNLKCSHCFYHDSLNKKFNELSIDELSKITLTMDPILHLILTGGEPYLREDLNKIVKVFYDNNRVPIVTIPSNGWYTEKMEHQIKLIMQNCPKITLNQQISIDGLDIDHNKIRMNKLVQNGRNSFERAIETIKMLKTMQKKFERINIGIISTFTKQNQYKFNEFIKAIYELTIPDNISINLVRGNPKERVNENLDIELYKEAVKFRDNLFYKKKLPGHTKFKGHKIATAARILLNELVTETFEKKKFQIPCYAGSISGVMYPEGDVYPCELLGSEHKIGNIRDFKLNFRKLWLSNKASQTKSFIKKTKCFCTHECFNHANIAFNPKIYPSLIKKILSL